MVLDNIGVANALLVDFNENRFAPVIIHVSRNGNEITCRGLNGNGCKYDNQFIFAVNSHQSSDYVEFSRMAAKSCFVQMRKPNNCCGFGAGFEAR